MKTFRIFNLIFLMFGISSIAIDPLIPYISDTLGVGYDKIGFALLLGSIFSLLSTFFSGIFCDRINIKRIVTAGLLLLFSGFFVFGIYMSFPVFVLVLILLRSGYGTIDSSIHSYVSQMYKKNHSPLFLKLDLYWYSGAVLGPMAIGGALLLGINPQFVFLFFGAAFAVLIISFHIISLKENDAPLHSYEKVFNLSEFGKALKNRVVILTSLVLFFMMGAQIGLSTWLTTYFTAFGVDVSFGSLILSFYWAFSTLGLYLGIRLLPKSNEITLLLVSAVAGTLFLTASSLLGAPWLKIAFLLLQGMFFSVVFALSISISAHEDNKMKGTIMGFNIASALLGGLVLQPILGLVAEYIGKQYTIFAVLAAAVLGAFSTAALFTALRKKYGTKIMLALKKRPR
ncbi:MAG: MFS transporter [Actinomycetota bacterium]